ncbi:MAG: response regulator [Pseudorhodoplanes sp.]|nr:response regulator [Pseudorhodoplanes sp.]
MARSPHILVIEDDRETGALIARYLRDNAYRPTLAPDGRDLDEMITTQRIDLVVLDLMLPGEDGLSLCRRLRSRSHVPIIMLTAKGQDIDRIVGLEMGADDYLTKPFNPRELLARIRAVLRRAGTAALTPFETAARTLTFEGWTIDRGMRELRGPDGTRIAVTGAEFDLLQILCERPGRVLSRSQLVELTQGRAAGAFERSIDILISRLRRKIEHDPHHPRMIKTIRSGGYVFTPTVAAS